MNRFFTPIKLLIASCSLCASALSFAASCDAPEHRGFDFWLGDWRVQTPAGKLAGMNRIASIQGGCALREQYMTGKGYSGESLSIYDSVRKVWHQTWVDTSGMLLMLEGGLRDGKMILEGTTTKADGGLTQHRVTWTPVSDGSVRQHWETKVAQEDWKTAFDGNYTRQ